MYCKTKEFMRVDTLNEYFDSAHPFVVQDITPYVPGSYIHSFWEETTDKRSTTTYVTTARLVEYLRYDCL